MDKDLNLVDAGASMLDTEAGEQKTDFPDWALYITGLYHRQACMIDGLKTMLESEPNLPRQVIRPLIQKLRDELWGEIVGKLMHHGRVPNIMKEAMEAGGASRELNGLDIIPEKWDTEERKKLRNRINSIDQEINALQQEKEQAMMQFTSKLLEHTDFAKRALAEDSQYYDVFQASF